MVQVNGQDYFLEPVNRFDANASSDLFVVYKGTDLRVDASIKCGVQEMESAYERINPEVVASSAAACAEVAIASDYSMVQNQGSVANVESEVISILNMVTAKYQETPMEISYDLVENYVVSCNGCDPWTSSTDASTLLSSFTGWGGFSKTYDIASLWTKRDITNNGNSGVIGLAYVGVVCTNSRYNLMEHYFNSLGGNMVDQTHEMGHNWSCNHGSENSVNIMSPSIGPSNTTWTTTSQNSIVNHKNSRNCLTASCQSPPVANFVANTTVLSAGGSVDFTDLSSGNPNAWSWSFGGGGTPDNSSVQHPSNIVFNTPGLYTVTLIATNANGSDTAVKVDYIKVNANVGCDTLNYGFYQGKDTPAWTITHYYMSGGAAGEFGWVNGCNANEETAKAQYFPSAAPYTHIMGGWLHLALAHSSDPNKVVPVKIWDGTGGTVGNELGSVDVKMSLYESNAKGNFFTQVLFDPPVQVPASGEFFMGVDITNLDWATDKDTFSIVCNTDGESSPSMVWERTSDGSTWQRYNTGSAWALDISLAIFPFMGEALPTVTLDVKDVCGSNCTGEIKANVTGGTPPYTYQWSTNASNQTVTNLCAGPYAVQIRQQSGCYGGIYRDTVKSVTNTMTVTATAMDANCNGDCDGTVSASGASGVTPYSYEWSTLGAGQAHGSVCAGTYTVTVMDDVGCTTTTTATVNEPTALAMEASQSQIDNSSCDGEATAVGVSGGTPPYTYQWDDGNSQTTATATGLCNGVYELCITDSLGCVSCDTALVHLAIGVGMTDPAQGISLYPNPANDHCTLQFDLQSEANLTISVSNAIGKLVSREQVRIQRGVHKVDMHQLPAGVYHVVVQGDGVSFNRSLVVNRP
ncbi:MAG: PKD domain-containing protein [Flavobacteriales bacterium]|nr:PKD domain-containing protein [Flavobacteriales bacterium]